MGAKAIIKSTTLAPKPYKIRKRTSRKGAQKHRLSSASKICSIVSILGSSLGQVERQGGPNIQNYGIKTVQKLEKRDQEMGLSKDI